MYIILNYQITKRVMCVVLCYSITNWIVNKFFIFDPFIINVVFLVDKCNRIHVIDAIHKNKLPPVSPSLDLTFKQ